jgi:hypothetical protein
MFAASLRMIADNTSRSAWSYIACPVKFYSAPKKGLYATIEVAAPESWQRSSFRAACVGNGRQP